MSDDFLPEKRKIHGLSHSFQDIFQTSRASPGKKKNGASPGLNDARHDREIHREQKDEVVLLQLLWDRGEVLALWNPYGF